MENQSSNEIRFFEEEDHVYLLDALEALLVDTNDGLQCEIPTVLRLAYHTTFHFVEKTLQLINDGEQGDIVLNYFTNEEVQEVFKKAELEGDTVPYEEMQDCLCEVVSLSASFEQALLDYVNGVPATVFEEIFIRELIDFYKKQNIYIPLLPGILEANASF